MRKASRRPDCHPDKPYAGRGLCRTCYVRAYRDGTLEASPRRGSIAQVVTCGHPEAIHWAEGLCQKCYMVQWRAEHSEQRKEAIGAWREGNAEHVRAYKRNWERTHRAQKALADHAQYDKDPLRGWARTLASKYGPEAVSAYHRLLREQDGKCAICRVSESRRKLDLDHDHATGMVRGLLCNSCNLGLGKFGDDPVRLEAAAEYLRRING